MMWRRPSVGWRAANKPCHLAMPLVSTRQQFAAPMITTLAPLGATHNIVLSLSYGELPPLKDGTPNPLTLQSTRLVTVTAYLKPKDDKKGEPKTLQFEGTAVDVEEKLKTDLPRAVEMITKHFSTLDQLEAELKAEQEKAQKEHEAKKVSASNTVKSGVKSTTRYPAAAAKKESSKEEPAKKEEPKEQPKETKKAEEPAAPAPAPSAAGGSAAEALAKLRSAPKVSMANVPAAPAVTETPAPAAETPAPAPAPAEEPTPAPAAEPESPEMAELNRIAASLDDVVQM